ncbi:MAG TPA: diaminopimelate decarboxylase [Pseudothermotoga sp.]|nr:diaminopimelate decarboxylase [Pseudothermotoga sp.]HOK84339.1 diaminopimelate decarboxylase [Pseudothermotoga sp.]HPP70751.1 diaminopimelate decarboxylase [Pseudothermotoga sp.]
MDSHTLVDAAMSFGTPLYVYDLPFVLQRISVVTELFKDFDFHLAFAVKANFNKDILSALEKSGAMVDVVSFGEYNQVRSVGFTPDRIIVNGNCKKKEELDKYVQDGVFSINLDSYEELLRLETVLSRPARVSIRVNPDVDAKTHRHIATGLRENKFGVDFDTASAMIERIRSNKMLELIGLHCHIGSQITEVEPYLEAVVSIKYFARSVGLRVQVFNLGGGWGIDYGNGKSLDLEEYRQKIFPILKEFGSAIVLELGRWIVAPSAYLVSKVEYVKKTASKIFVMLDTGMTHLIRPALYGAKHKIIPLYETKGRKKIKADVVGPICESADTFRKSYTMAEPKEGEFVAICDVGAYGYAMASDYNLIPKPKEVIWDGKKLFRSS